MNIDIRINQDTCFYYWVQTISGWSIYSGEAGAYEYYQAMLGNISETESTSIRKVRSVLNKSTDPRKTLAELYSGDIISDESKSIVKLAKNLQKTFIPVWEESKPTLDIWRKKLEKINFSVFKYQMDQIVRFLDADFNTDEPLVLYLIQNPPFGAAIGHTISNSSFILIHPAGSDRINQESTTKNTIIHEYIHAIEFRSNITRNLFKESYKKLIEPHSITAPTGYDWKMIYIETIAYCFANNITGGYFRPETYNAPRPNIEEMKDSFYKMVARKQYNTNHIISWVALNILSDVELYINQQKSIDQHLTDKISKLFLEFYLTHNQ